MKKITYCCVLMFLCMNLQAQNVTITPDGITPVSTHPRISYDAILALPSPQEGDLAYDTTFKCLRIYTDGKWLCSYQDPVNYTPNIIPVISVKGVVFQTSPAIATDASGNVYIIGHYAGSITLGANTLTASGSSDIFIAKYNKSGVVQWAQSAGGTASELGTDIAVDAAGNVYITGGFSGTATFGSESVIANGSNMDVFVAKYSNAGVVQWAKSANGTGNDVGASIVVDANSNAYITGNYASIVMFGDHLISSQSSSADIFVAKCNSSGEFLWVQSAGGAGNDSGSGIGIDGSGNIYLTGSYTGLATFGNIQTTSNGNLDIFVAKYNNSGTFLWVKSAGAADYDIGQSLAVESNGNVYVTGSYFGTITFGSHSVTSQGSRDLFVTKYDSSGGVIWAKTAGGTFLEGGLGIAVDAGGVYVTGHYSSTVSFGSKTINSNGNQYDILIVKYNKATGNFIWVQTAGGSDRDEGNNIAVDGNGNVYAIGTYTGTAQFGKITKTSQGPSDVFVVRIDK